jgi:hypothetical protein
MKELQFQIEGVREGQFRRPKSSRRASRRGDVPLLLAAAVVALLYNQPVVVANVTPLRLDFGTVAENASADQSIQVANRGPAMLNVRNAVLSGSNAADFSVISYGCPVWLVPGDSCSIGIRFLPRAVAAIATARSASLDVIDDALDSPQHVDLKGTGAPRDDLAISPSPVQFGTQEAGTTSAPKPVQIRNTAGFPLALRRIDLTDDTNTEFLLDRGECLSAPINPQGTCVINVSFNPRAATPVEAALTIADETGDSPHKVRLQGNGLPPGASHIQIRPASIDFPNQRLKERSPEQTITFTSTGSEALRINQVVLTGDQNDFHVVDRCSGAVIAQKGTCTAGVSFQPLAGGERRANLNVSDNAGDDPHSVSLTGIGSIPYTRLDVAPTSLWFPERELKTKTAPLTVTLSNTGTVPVTITGISVSGLAAGDFLVLQKCLGLLNPGERCVVLVSFQPLAAGVRSASLVTEEASPSPMSHQVGLEGSGKNPGFAEADIHPLVLSFAPDQSAQMQTAIVTSVGAVPLEIRTVSIDPPSVKSFSIIKDSCSGTSLPRGKQCSLDVVFRSSAGYGRLLDTSRLAGEFSAEVILRDNTPASQHQVHLHAVPATPPAPVASFNVAPRELVFKQKLRTRGEAQSLTVTNTGMERLALSEIRIQPGPFERGPANCDLSRIEPHQGCRIEVSFVPNSAGRYQSILEIGAAGSSIDVSLVGEASERELPAPPAPAVGWCCIRGKIGRMSPDACKLGRGYFFLDESRARTECSTHIVPIFRPNVEVFTPPQRPIR